MLRRQIGDHVDEMAGIKGFRHMDLKARGENGVAIDRRRVRRQRDGRHKPPTLAITSADPTDQSVTVVIGHPDIGYENVGPGLVVRCKRFGYRGCGAHGTALRLEQNSKQLASIVVILDDEDVEPSKTVRIRRTV